MDDFPMSSVRTPSTAYRTHSARSFGGGFSPTHHHGGAYEGTPKERDLMVQVMQKDSKIRVSACSLGNIVEKMILTQWQQKAPPRETNKQATKTNLAWCRACAVPTDREPLLNPLPPHLSHTHNFHRTTRPRPRSPRERHRSWTASSRSARACSREPKPPSSRCRTNSRARTRPRTR